MSYLRDQLDKAETSIDKGKFRRGFGALQHAFYNTQMATSTAEFDSLKTLLTRVAAEADGRVATKARGLIPMVAERRASYEERQRASRQQQSGAAVSRQAASGQQATPETLELAERGEKVCPDCAETIKAEARVCRFCGYRFDGNVAASPPGANARPVVPYQGTSFGARQSLLLWVCGSVLLMLIGAFGPWLKALGQSVSGTDGGNDGWLVVGAGLIAGLLFIAARRNRGAGVLGVIGGLIGAFVTIHDRSHVSAAINNGGALTQALVRVGWGLNLAMVASISLGVAGIIWLFAIESETVPSPALPPHEG
ncbi:MAG: zinc ribbon domain-containing protein [Gaiellaceae bacterium]